MKIIAKIICFFVWHNPYRLTEYGKDGTRKTKFVCIRCGKENP